MVLLTLAASVGPVNTDATLSLGKIVPGAGSDAFAADLSLYYVHNIGNAVLFTALSFDPAWYRVQGRPKRFPILDSEISCVAGIMMSHHRDAERSRATRCLLGAQQYYIIRHIRHGFPNVEPIQFHWTSFQFLGDPTVILACNCNGHPAFYWYLFALFTVVWAP